MVAAVGSGELRAATTIIIDVAVIQLEGDANSKNLGLGFATVESPVLEPEPGRRVPGVGIATVGDEVTASCSIVA